MHELERKANKHFRVFTDYEKRQQELQAHAVKLVLMQDEGMNPNLPMIPAPQSAHFRRHCAGCRTVFWAAGMAHYCEECAAAEREEDRLEAEVNRYERLLRVRDLREKVRKMKDESEELNDLSDELAQLSTPRKH